MAAGDVELFSDRAVSNDVSNIVFKIGERVYRNVDLDRRIKARLSMYDKSPDKTNITDEQRRGLAKNYFRHELIKRDACKKVDNQALICDLPLNK